MYMINSQGQVFQQKETQIHVHKSSDVLYQVSQCGQAGDQDFAKTADPTHTVKIHLYPQKQKRKGLGLKRSWRSQVTRAWSKGRWTLQVCTRRDEDMMFAWLERYFQAHCNVVSQRHSRDQTSQIIQYNLHMQG